MPGKLFTEFEPGAVLAGRYQVLEILGSGAMGRVLKVADRTLDNDVIAIKMLFPHLVKDAVAFARFRNEVLVARKLSHKNIVKLYDLSSIGNDLHFISMEYIQGRPLSSRMRSPTFPPLTLPEVVHILSEIGRGMAAAHAAKVIHRDLKPENVLLSDENEIKIADFGLARSLLIDKGLTEAGHTVGTPYYMSPEQITGGTKLDGRADIYSLGIIAYELATGRKPFEDESWFNLSTMHLTKPMPKLGEAHFSVPAWFEEFVQTCTAKDPNDRFKNAEELVKALAGRFEEKVSEKQRPSETVELRKAPKPRKKGPKVGAPAVFAAASVLLFFFVLALVFCRFVPGLNRRFGGTVLAYEKSSGVSFPILKTLLDIDFGVKPEELGRAVLLRDARAVSLLITAGVDPEAVLAEGKSAYDLAIEQGDTPTLEAMINSGANPNYRNGAPLLRAVADDSPDRVALVLRAKASPDAREAGTGRTALMLAVRNKNDAAVLDLLNAGADVNAKDKAGKTPLMYAAEAGDLAILDRLFDWNPPLNEVDDAGQTALTIALSRNHTDVAERLTARGAEISISGRSGKLRAAPRRP